MGLAVMVAGTVGVDGGATPIQNSGNIPVIDGKARMFDSSHAKLFMDKPSMYNFKITWGKVTVISDKSSMKAFVGERKLWEFNDNCFVIKKYFPIYIDEDFLLAYCSDSTDLVYSFIDRLTGKKLTIRGQPIFRDDLYVYYISALSFDEPAIIRRFSIDSDYNDEYFLKIKLVTYLSDCSNKKNYGIDLLRFYRIVGNTMIFRAIGKSCSFQQEVSLTGELTYSGARR